jgi:hypothetical protein
MKSCYRHCLLWAWLAAGVFPAHAQHCLSLTGTWNLNMSKSMFGTDKIPTQQPEKETLTIQQSGAEIRQTWEYQGSLVKGRSSYSFVADGTEQKPVNLAPAAGGATDTAATEGNPFGIRRGGPGMPQSLKPEWENCTLIVTETGGGRGGGRKSKYVLTKDGRQLTIYQESSGGMGDSEKRWVFDKQ